MIPMSRTRYGVCSFGGTGKSSLYDFLLESFSLTSIARQIFPGYSSAPRPFSKTSILAKIRAKRALRKDQAVNNITRGTEQSQ